MTEPQVWVFMGLFATFAFSTIAVISGNFTRVLRAEIGGLRSEMNGSIDTLRAEVNGSIGEVRAEMSGLRAEMNARFDTVNLKIEHLDADVAALTRRVMGEHD